MFLLIILLFILLFFLGFFVIIYLKRNKNLICLMYHNVMDNPPEGIISTEEFEKHMRYIKDKRTFKMEELKNLGYKLPRDAILVTFDDGYKNNYTKAYPILKKYGIKATIFINTQYVGNSAEYLSWDEMLEMYESGLVDIQLHTHSHGLTIRKTDIKGFFTEETTSFVKREHYNLFYRGIYEHEKDAKKMDGLPIFKTRSRIAHDGYVPVDNFVEKYRGLKNVERELGERKSEFFKKISKKEYEQIVKYEILENKRIIKEKLGKEANVLAYPWGHKYKGHKKDMLDMGVDMFVLTGSRKNNYNLGKKEISRINADKFTDFAKFKSLIGKY